MNLKRIFLSAIVVVVVSSCRELPLNFGGDRTIASVEDMTLKMSDIDSSVFKGLSPEDSISYITRYAEKWIQNRVKLLESERVFASSAQDIESLVEEYRNSLMVRKLEKYYISENFKIENSDEQIEEYYNQYSDNFRLSTRLVKGRIIAIPKDYKALKELQKQITTLADKRGGDFKSICEKSGLELVEFMTSWVEYSDFLNLLPIVKHGDYSEYTSSLGVVHQLEGRDFRYMFQITEVLNIGDTEPLERVKEKIIYILNNKNQTEFLRKYDSQLLEDAQQRGVVRNYVKEKQEKQ
ncbi:MAG: hypothetical protein SNG10_00400 [Rikenellaceae bacterium]